MLCAAGPGTGKSAFTLTLALKANVSCLYFSADSDAATQLSRALCVLTGTSMYNAEQMVLRNDLGAAGEQIANTPIRFSYDASPTLDRIESVTEAYEELFGDYPALIIIDNVTNVRFGGGEDDGDPFSGLEGLMDYLHTMARQTGACVVGLHHVTGPFNDAEKPIPLSGVKGQIGRVPEIVLTLHKKTEEGQADILAVSTVKNRGGKADPSGNMYAELEFIGDRMRIADPGGHPQLSVVPDPVPEQQDIWA